MDIYRAILRPRSATLSPWQADTLFGHLCWLILYEEGQTALADFLAQYKGASAEPPLLFSNGFPGDFLPRPLLPPPAYRPNVSKADQIAEMRRAKTVKAMQWVDRAEFNQLRQGGEPALTPRSNFNGTRTELKNQINRLTFGTSSIEEDGEGGALYNIDELAYVDKSTTPWTAPDISIYVKVKDAAWAERAERLLQSLARSGYGARKTVGYGHFALEGEWWQQFDGFEPVEAANGFISLSNWTPAQHDPTTGFYRRLIKYGKLGESLANTDNPFKFPLLMLTAGSSFYTVKPPHEWYGRLVAGIAPDHPEVVQYGFAFVIPARLAETPNH